MAKQGLLPIALIVLGGLGCRTEGDGTPKPERKEAESATTADSGAKTQTPIAGEPVSARPGGARPKPKTGRKEKTGTLEDAEKELAAKWAKTTSMTADLKLFRSSKTGVGLSTTNGHGTFEFLKKDGKVMFRNDMEMVSKLTWGDIDRGTFEALSVTVCDDKFMYDYAKSPKENQVTKYQANATRSFDGKTLYEAHRKDNNLKLMSDETIDGQPVYVIEATPKGRSSVEKKSIYIAKDTGVILKIAGRNWGGVTTSSLTFTNVKINPKISPERFVFKVPEGATVVDKTKD